MNKNKLISLTHKLAKKTGLPFNSVLTYFFMEEVLNKITKTEYRDNFIFKGGFLLSNIVGINQRSTIDIDMLLQDMPIGKERLESVFGEIFSETDENIKFEVQGIEEIKKDDIYGGYRIVVQCKLENIKVNIPLDIATGDPVTPNSVFYNYKPIFREEQIIINSYNVETIVAEKLETIYSRSYANSRSKDFYDVFIIYKMHGKILEFEKVREACMNTFNYRNTELDFEKLLTLVNNLKLDNNQERLWINYSSKRTYARELDFVTVMDGCLKFIRDLKDNHS